MSNELLNRYTPVPTDNADWFRHVVPAKPFSISPHGSPYRCYHIQTDYIALLLGLLDYYAYSDAFVGTELEKEQSAGFINSLRLLLMTGNMECGGGVLMRIRQSATSDCVLEVSYDGGATWQVGFDFGLCFTTMQAGTDINLVNSFSAIQNQTQALVNEYDGSPGSIAPSMDYDGGYQDTFRDKTVCAAIHQAVQLAAATAGGLMQDLDALLWDVSMKVVRIQEIFIQIAEKIPLGSTFEEDLVSRLFWWVAKKHVASQRDYWEEHTPTDRFGDYETRREITCFAYNSMKGFDFTFEKFRGMFHNVATLANVTVDDELFLTNFVADLEIYLLMLDWMENFNADLIGGVVDFHCPCDEWEVVVTDFRAIPNAVSRQFIDGAGEYSPTGLLVANDAGPGDSVRLAFSFMLPTPYRSLEGELVYTAFNLSDEDSSLELRHGYVPVFYQELLAAGHEKDVSWEHPGQHSVFVIYFDTGLTGVYAEVSRLTLRGVGDNPFV